MPELPEVQTVVSTLQPRLAGLTITQVDLRRSDIVQPAGADLCATCLNRTIRAIDRRGKRIVFTLDNDIRFYIHLGMSGQLTIADDSTPERPHTHMVLHARRGQETVALRFRDPRRFGGIFMLSSDSADPLGPEPLTLSSRQLHGLLQKTARPIKNALLDQRLIAGLGNIYVDESLHAAGIHPLTPADRLSPQHAATLNRCIKQVLRRAIRHRGSTLRDYVNADRSPGGFQRLHRVYGREGAPCPNCRRPIERIVLQGRSTHFCPACQPPLGKSKS
jgi:formamidopyrimidine-DNA glycosylase